MTNLVGSFVFCLSIFSETSVAAQGAPTGYEIREKQSFMRLAEGAGLNQRETWFPTLSKDRLGPIAAT